jgi:hypothetical protein
MEEAEGFRGDVSRIDGMGVSQALNQKTVSLLPPFRLKCFSLH